MPNPIRKSPELWILTAIVLVLTYWAARYFVEYLSGMVR